MASNLKRNLNSSTRDKPITTRRNMGVNRYIDPETEDIIESFTEDALNLLEDDTKYKVMFLCTQTLAQDTHKQVDSMKKDIEKLKSSIKDLKAKEEIRTSYIAAIGESHDGLTSIVKNLTDKRIPHIEEKIFLPK